MGWCPPLSLNILKLFEESREDSKVFDSPPRCRIGYFSHFWLRRFRSSPRNSFSIDLHVVALAPQIVLREQRTPRSLSCPLRTGTAALFGESNLCFRLLLKIVIFVALWFEGSVSENKTRIMEKAKYFKQCIENLNSYNRSTGQANIKL